MRFKAYLGKITIDSEGEIKLLLVVSKTEAKEVITIPTETILDVEIKDE